MCYFAIIILNESNVFSGQPGHPVKGALNPNFLNLTINREKFLL